MEGDVSWAAPKQRQKTDKRARNGAPVWRVISLINCAENAQARVHWMTKNGIWDRTTN